MAAYFGPESPRPFSVISEKYQSLIPFCREQRELTFGDVYETAWSKMLTKYGEINVDDRMCYVGESRGSFAACLQRRLNLIHPIEQIDAGHIHYEAAETGRRFPVRVMSYGAEEQVAEQALECGRSGESRFDKIVLKDALEFFEDKKIFFYNLMQTLGTQGKLVIIQRPSQMLTLPYFTEAKKRVEDTEAAYLDVITELQELGYDVEWEIEVLPVVLSRSDWLNLLQQRYPNQLEVLSDDDVISGLRELAEGPLKYSEEDMEFVDRLLVVVVTHPLDKEAMPECKRFGGSVLSAEPAPTCFQLPVTREIGPAVRKMEERELLRRQARRAPAGSVERQGEEWFGTMQKSRWVNVDSERIPSKRVNRLLPPLHRVS